MKVSVSLTTKVMVVLLAMILTLCIAITTALIIQSNNRIQQEQVTLQQQNHARYRLLSELLENRALLWIEAFSTLSTSQFNSAEKLAASLRQISPYMELNLNIEGLWVFNNEDKLFLGEESGLPQSAVGLAAKTKIQLRPLSHIDCEFTCEQVLAVPLMLPPNDIAVVIVRSSLRELLALLSESSNARLAIVKRSPDPLMGSPRLALDGELSPQHLDYFTNVVQALPDMKNFGALVDKGVQIKLMGADLLVSLLPLEQAIDRGSYIVLVNDITKEIAANRLYQRWVVGGAMLLFSIFCLILYFLLNGYRHKMVSLSQRLPLLSQHRYEEFRQQTLYDSPPFTKRFPDELDVLESATSELVDELEDLNSQVAQNTAQLERMALFDSLTGLPNRNMLTYQIEKRLSEGVNPEGLVSIMFIDLDDFKKVNDSYGHDVGDQLLKKAAERISKPLSVDDIASRFGGDEFVILLGKISVRDQIKQLAQQLLDQFQSPVQVGDMNFYISLSIGISIAKASQASPVELLRHADIAMYEAKNHQGAAFQIYDTTMNQKVLRKVELESEARIALRDNQFYLALQPQIELKTRKLIGFEALLRWHHPVKGQIPPGEFIPLLENTSFMIQLDYWVISKAMRLLKELKAHGYGDVKVAINLSAGQFMDPSLKDYLVSQIQEHNIPASCIELELTETALVADMNRATSIMRDIQSLGCQIAIDDFGTGYSSLSYLKSLPADLIKIDQSFVRGMLDSRDDRNIVYSTIAMVRNMGLKVVAEGIETSEQYELLGHFDCHFGQGYLISKPIKEDHLWSQLDGYVVDGKWGIRSTVDFKGASSRN